MSTSVLGVVGLLVLGAPADDEPEWVKPLAYPSASHAQESTSDGSKRGVYTTLMTTPDSFEDVLTHYEKALNAKLTAKGGRGAHRARIDSGWMCIYDDSVTAPEEGANARPFQLRVFTRDTKKDTVTLVISRGDQEQHTHIVITYLLKK